MTTKEAAMQSQLARASMRRWALRWRQQWPDALSIAESFRDLARTFENLAAKKEQAQ
jgi:hypothetical protein